MLTLDPIQSAPAAGIMLNEVTLVSFPDGFTIGPSETVNPAAAFNVVPAIAYQPEFPTYYYVFLFANVDGVLTTEQSFIAKSYAICYYKQTPVNPQIGNGDGVTPWCVFAYDAVTGSYLNPSSPLVDPILSSKPTYDAAVGPYPDTPVHAGATKLPSAVDCLIVTPPQPEKNEFLIEPTITAARSGDTDVSPEPQPNTTYAPDFDWFVLSFSERATTLLPPVQHPDYQIGPPSAAGQPLGGSIVLRGSAGGIVHAVYSLKATAQSTGPTCAQLAQQLAFERAARQSLIEQIAKNRKNDPMSTWPTTVFPLEEQLASDNATIVSLESQLTAKGCPGY